MVTRNDVAKLAKVSPAVVSYVINNSNYVSAEKRKAVLDAIEKLNYIPNQNAKNLKQSRTYMIAIVRGNQLNDMFNDLLYYLEGLANSHGYIVSLMTVVKDNDFYATDQFVNALISRRFDAIFVANSSLTEQQINSMVNNGIRVLLYVTRSYFGLDPRVSRIIPNYRMAVKEIISKLIDLGHTKIVLVPNSMYPTNFQTFNNHRIAGYFEAFAERGLLAETRYIVDSSQNLDQSLDLVEEMFRRYTGDDAPTALYADETIVVASILKRLNAMGLRVPEDVSLVCSSNSTMATITTPQLTAVGFDPKRLAEISMQMLENLIDRNQAEEVEIGFDFYERESTAPPNH